jgi:3-methyladenine DNA glycosylase/8-oxoguanine DNA glycosylase
MKPRTVWKFGRVFSPELLSKAVAHLKRRDRKLASVIDKVGDLEILPGFRPFDALIVSILYQQLAGTAAQAILNRFRALYGDRFPTPKEILETPDERLRMTGLSRRKVECLKDLSSKVAEGALDLDGLSRLGDEAVIAELDKVKGIGRWTAQMFLIFPLGRPDVLPAGDLGLRMAVKSLYGLKELPGEEEVEKIGAKWRPYRTVASLYLWRSQEVKAPA